MCSEVCSDRFKPVKFGVFYTFLRLCKIVGYFQTWNSIPQGVILLLWWRQCTLSSVTLRLAEFRATTGPCHKGLAFSWRWTRENMSGVLLRMSRAGHIWEPLVWTLVEGSFTSNVLRPAFRASKKLHSQNLPLWWLLFEPYIVATSQTMVRRE